ncbi:MAG: thioredoxin domain-containing protein [Trueperaceae bacterium]|nr:thioredoxin domain-containing protein [Trueperaceae bacterium]
MFDPARTNAAHTNAARTKPVALEAAPALRTPRHVLRVAVAALLGVAAALASLPAAAQAIGDDAEAFLAAADASAAGDAWVAGDLDLRIDRAGSLLRAVEVEGAFDADGVARAAELFAVASGYGDAIREPIASYLNENLPGLAGQGPVGVGVVDLGMEVDVAFGASLDAPSGTLRLSRPQVPSDAFGTPVATLGNADAPVTVRVFSDFQCPFCQRYAQQVMPMLEDGVLADGDVNFAFHHFPLNSIHPNATPAAAAAQCVRDLYGDAFWPYHDAIFERLDAWAQLGEPEPYFVDLTTEVPAVVEAAGGASDAEQAVAACLDEGDATQVVRDATDRAVNLGLQGTPSVFVGGYRLNDVASVEGYDRLVRLATAVAEVREEDAAR